MEHQGYSRTPLVKKLGIKEGHKVLFVNPPEHLFELLLGLPRVFFLDKPGKEGADFIQLFCTRLECLEDQFPSLKSRLNKNGMLWISWPKGTSSIPTDLNGNIVRRFGLLEGLVDVKVCAVDRDWSGLKFMFRRKDRK